MWVLYLDFKLHGTSMSFKSWLGLWKMLEVPDWGFVTWPWFWYSHWSLVFPYAKFWLSILILKVQRTSMSFKSWLGLWRTLEVLDLSLTSSSWFRYGHCFFINPHSKFWLSIFVFKGAKIINVLIRGFGGHWRFLTGVWHLDLHLNMVIALW